MQLPLRRRVEQPSRRARAGNTDKVLRRAARRLPGSRPRRTGQELCSSSLMGAEVGDSSSSEPSRLAVPLLLNGAVTQISEKPYRWRSDTSHRTLAIFRRLAFVDLLDGDDFDIGGDVVLAAKIEHLLRFGDSTNGGSGKAASPHDQAKRRHIERLGRSADQRKIAVNAE